VLKHEVKPLEEITAQYAGLSYNAPNAELDSEVANAILNWLNKQTQSNQQTIKKEGYAGEISQRGMGSNPSRPGQSPHILDSYSRFLKTLLLPKSQTNS